MSATRAPRPGWHPCMRRTLALALALVTAALAAPAAADAAERQIADGEAYEISTYRGWLLWTTTGRQVVLWRGSPRAFDPPGSGATGVLRARLGSDSRGRTSIAYERCATESGVLQRWFDCEVVQHLVATGTERTILKFRDSYDLLALELSQGSLAVTRRRDQSERHALWLFAPGSTERRLSADDPPEIDIERGRLTYVANRGDTEDRGEFGVARAVDLRPSRPRYRTLATHDGRDVDGRIPGATVTRFESAATDGVYAYWLRADLRDSGSSYEVWRADLRDASANVVKCTLERSASSIAVAGGRIYYAGASSTQRGVFEVIDPAWRDTGLTTPVND
jgi:hypothetical protein